MWQKGHRVVPVDADPQCNLRPDLGYKGRRTLSVYKTEPERNLRASLRPSHAEDDCAVECVVPAANLFLLLGRIGLSEDEVTWIAQELSGQ
jgi:CO dehydrogenase nickel-insertion accessory protein CooC1